MFRAPSLPPPSSLQFSAVTTLPSGYKSLFLPHVLTRHDVPLPGVCCLPRGSSQNFFPCRPIAATLAAAPTFAAAFTAAVANADAVRWRWSAPPPSSSPPPPPPPRPPGASTPPSSTPPPPPADALRERLEALTLPPRGGIVDYLRSRRPRTRLQYVLLRAPFDAVEGAEEYLR